MVKGIMFKSGGWLLDMEDVERVVEAHARWDLRDVALREGFRRTM